ncbi:MAG: DUF433 domain-containing protein [Bacteroidetes bacterium]|nr:DUF433 domain-containing protein [Bacteroidota bacterium]
MTTETLQTKPILGQGIYTMPDIAFLLGLSYPKVNRWINSFWNDKFGSKYGNTYSWIVDLTKAVNFYTLIELYTFYQLSAAGVSTKEVIKAHEILSDQFNTPYPFATKQVLSGIRTDGHKVLFDRFDHGIYSVDIHRQFKIEFVREFYKNLEFDSNSLVIRFYPKGKERSIVCDPAHQFGQPVIDGTNILSETVYRMHLAKEPMRFIADLYEIPVSKVKNAIDFHKSVA